MNKPHEHSSKNQSLSLNYRRFRAALDLRGLTVEDIARQAGVSSRHIWFVLNGQRRPSPSVLSTIRDSIGESGFLFATGQRDTLRDDSAASEAQPCR